jgi:ParB-like chromosome segregation protein Spo0J
VEDLKPVHLRIVDTDQVRPHEVADAVRERKIEHRLKADGVLRDPLMLGAVPDVDGYVLLDGTNRKQALVELGYPRVMVQVMDYADPRAVQLQTWCHAAPMPIGALLQSAATIPGLVAAPLPPLAVADALADAATLAVLLGKHERFALTRVRDYEGSRVEQLRQLVDLYEERMVRVDCNADEVEEQAQRLSGEDESRVLIAFPRFSRSQVVSMAMGNALIPAGITRHIILCGRALRVNLPLEYLEGSHSAEKADRALQAHLSTLAPRTYTEPTILFDS